MVPDRVVSPTPALRWEDAMVSGNGSTGIMVMGRPLDERIIVDHERLWVVATKLSIGKFRRMRSMTSVCHRGCRWRSISSMSTSPAMRSAKGPSTARSSRLSRSAQRAMRSMTQPQQRII